MTSQIRGSGKHKCETVICIMENTKDDSPLKARFFVLRKEIYKHYKEIHQTEQQADSTVLKQVMSEHERESEVDSFKTFLIVR